MVTNQYIKWLKKKNQSSNFFPPFTVILNFSTPKLWFSIYLFKKCSEGRCRWVWVLAPPPTTRWEGWISNTVLFLGVCPAHRRRHFCSLPISLSTSLSASFLEKADTFIHQSSIGIFSWGEIPAPDGLEGMRNGRSQLYFLLILMVRRRPITQRRWT